MRRANESLRPARAFTLPLVLAAALVACVHAKNVNEGNPEGAKSAKASKAEKDKDKKADDKKDVAAKDGEKGEKKDGGGKEEHASAEPKPATGTESHDEPPTDGQGGSGLRRASRRPTGTLSHDEPPSDNVPGQNKTGVVLADTPSGLHKPGGDAKIAQALKDRGFLKDVDAKNVSADQLTAAVRKFQHSKDTEETGYADEQTLRLLGLDPRDIVRKP